MEKIRQVINADGLQIPLPLVSRYGLQPGARVTLELDEHGIHITPVLPNRQDIENLALQYLLTNLGDAVTVQVIAEKELWWIDVYGAGLDIPLGQLAFSLTGHLLPGQSTTPEVMRKTAISAYQDK
ncbi:MAG: hypothetical protein H6662_10665 [Ardenticatenaceae bacterium]|nr:hypothetical protein [Anaerolineales bacterium]MCB8922037.1 hypothetical protein [Ardenticatenaceae bacterium]MCB8989613.1 hypothetical protein [Ardenticatenaceae bacterium]MCB9003156.1 hypothetical protein [Ardenticatenaceae bacterium]